MALTNPALLDAIIKAQVADDAWSDELARLFGKKAGDVRYTERGRGDESSRLRQLHSAFRSASDKAHKAWMNRSTTNNPSDPTGD